MNKTKTYAVTMAAMFTLVGACGPFRTTETPKQSTLKEYVASPEQQAFAKRIGLPVVVENSIGMRLVLIPAGAFLMGSSGSANDTARRFSPLGPKWFAGEHPQHAVVITRSFYFGMCEVTREEYARVMENRPRHILGPQQPAEPVRWDSAMAFCQKLSLLPDERAAGRSYRLPTEAEWEYACRAGTSTEYSSGDDRENLRNYAWFSTNSDRRPHPAGEKGPNAWGLYDMHGNLWEWCSDWYGAEYYSDSPVADPQGPASGSARVHRGGCFDSPEWACRSAYRDKLDPKRCYADLGFRVVADVSRDVPAHPSSEVTADSASDDGPPR